MSCKILLPAKCETKERRIPAPNRQLMNIGGVGIGEFIKLTLYRLKTKRYNAPLLNRNKSAKYKKTNFKIDIQPLVYGSLQLRQIGNSTA